MFLVLFFTLFMGLFHVLLLGFVLSKFSKQKGKVILYKRREAWGLSPLSSKVL